MSQPNEPNERPPDRDPAEALFRNSPHGAAGQPRPTHYQSSVTRPEEQTNPNDQYGWLFRDESTAPPAPPPAAAPRTPATPPPPPAVPPVNTPEVEPERRRRRPAVTWIIAVVVVGVLAITAVVGYLLGPNRQGSEDPGTGASAGPAPQPSSPGGGPDSGSPSASSEPGGEPYTGQVTSIAADTAAAADCTAAPATDAGGNTVRYDPSLTTDGNLSTAWRCDGSGTGKSLTFVLPAGSKVAEVGLTNGYTKIDPVSGDDRYDEYRRITKVTWTFPNGVVVEQKLKDGTEGVQTVRTPVIESNQVTLTIESSTKPGQKAKTRDAILISEVDISVAG